MDRQLTLWPIATRTPTLMRKVSQRLASRSTLERRHFRQPQGSWTPFVAEFSASACSLTRPHHNIVTMRLFNVAATLIGVTACVGAAVVPTSTRTDLIAGVQALVRRRLPEHAESFEFTLLGVVSESSERVAQKVLGKGDGDSYIVSSTGNGKIHIQGNTPSALLSGYVGQSDSGLDDASRKGSTNISIRSIQTSYISI